MDPHRTLIIVVVLAGINLFGSAVSLGKHADDVKAPVFSLYSMFFSFVTLCVAAAQLANP